MRRLSLTNRLALLGVAFLLVVAAGVTAILQGFTGHFSTYDTVYADIPASGTGISPGSIVIFRDITVGQVANLGRQLPGGLLRVQLHINPQDLTSIPSGVHADVEIATVFGTQGINLVPPPAPGPAHLAIGQSIAPVKASQTTTLQGDATDLDNLLNALHPAALDQTLTAIATALRGQGKALGTTIASVSTYLNEMLPQLPAIVRDFQLLGPVTNNLAAAAPDIIATLSNGTVTAQTITTQAANLHQLLAGATPTVNGLTNLLQASGPAFEDLVANSAPLLADVNANPNEIAQTLHGFDQWSKAFVAAESQGPYLSFAGDLVISGSVQVVAAALGLPGTGFLVQQGLGPQFFNPPTYTAADCPRYAGQNGPNCPAASAATTKSAQANPSVTTGVVTTPAQQQAAVKIATALNHGKAPPSAAVTTLLLEPVLLAMAHAK
jgi:phospholipid/cholesterol/gamma-HCH transport system substrate-binding protein